MPDLVRSVAGGSPTGLSDVGRNLLEPDEVLTSNEASPGARGPVGHGQMAQELLTAARRSRILRPTDIGRGGHDSDVAFAWGVQCDRYDARARGRDTADNGRDAGTSTGRLVAVTSTGGTWWR